MDKNKNKMKIKLLFCTITIMLFFSSLIAQEKAETILNTSFKKAKVENKNVFIIFHASWCGWCKRMDASMNDISTKELFNKNYVIGHLVVQEAKNKKHLKNEGAKELLKKYGGENSGIPYWLILDAEGNLLADSKMLKNELVLKQKGENIGCPGTVEEVEALIYKLKKTSNLNPEELAIIAKRF